MEELSKDVVPTRDGRLSRPLNVEATFGCCADAPGAVLSSERKSGRMPESGNSDVKAVSSRGSQDDRHRSRPVIKLGLGLGEGMGTVMPVAVSVPRSVAASTGDSVGKELSGRTSRISGSSVGREASSSEVLALRRLIRFFSPTTTLY